MSDPVLQHVAFMLRPELASVPVELTGMQFPAAWKPPILGLAQELYGREQKAVSMPVRSLNRALAALVPHLITTPMWVGLKPDEQPPPQPVPWLLAEAPGNEEPVWAVIQSWLEQHFDGSASLAAVRDQIRKDQLSCEPFVCPRTVPLHENGTARPPHHFYSMLPAWIAQRLVDQEVTLPVLGAETRLLRVPCEDGAELMTWPPVQYRKKEKYGAFSYTVRISVHTHVGCPQFRIHFHFGVRRWVVRPLWDEKTLYLGKEAKSVYLRVSDGWLGIPPTGGFTVARLQASWGNGARFPVWSDGVPDIAARLGVPFPSAEEFAANPTDWLRSGGRNGIEAALVEKTPKWYPVQPGLGLDEHEQITRRLAAVLHDELVLCDPLIKLPPLQKTKKHPLTVDLREIAPEIRLDGVARSIGSNLEIEVLYRTREFRDWQVDRLRNLLCGEPPPKLPRGEQRAEWVPAPAQDEEEIAIPGGRLKIISRPMGAIGTSLTERSGDGKTWEHRRNATEARIKEIEREIPSVSGPALTIVDLPDYRIDEEMRKQRYRDPLLAIRRGYARLGRLTKFVDGRGDNLQHRCEATAREALRQLGYLPAPIGFSFRKAESLPAPLLIAAVWVIRLNRTQERKAIVLPVIVLMNTTDLQVRAWLPDGKGIRPYYRAELDIVRLDPERLSRTQEREQLAALRNFLLRELPREGTEDILILADAQNSRLTWQGMQNSEIRFGNLVFDRAGPVQPMDRLGARVRVVRLRTSERQETPEWFTPGAGANSGYSQGVWKDPGLPLHYFALGEKPPAMWGGRKGKQTDPGELYAQPSLLEILPVALQPGVDSPELWARAVYEWKRMSGVLTEGSTLRPLPLEFARHMSRYARALSPYVDPGFWTESEDGEDTEVS